MLFVFCPTADKETDAVHHNGTESGKEGEKEPTATHFELEDEETDDEHGGEADDGDAGVDEGGGDDELTFGEGGGAKATVDAAFFFGGEGVAEAENAHTDEAEGEEAGESVIELTEGGVANGGFFDLNGGFGVTEGAIDAGGDLSEDGGESATSLFGAFGVEDTDGAGGGGCGLRGVFRAVGGWGFGEAGDGFGVFEEVLDGAGGGGSGIFDSAEVGREFDDAVEDGALEVFLGGGEVGDFGDFENRGFGGDATFKILGERRGGVVDEADFEAEGFVVENRTENKEEN